MKMQNGLIGVISGLIHNKLTGVEQGSHKFVEWLKLLIGPSGLT